jgi:hypothetical protein
MFILFLVTLEFWRFIFLKNLNLSHDEFLYDKSLNSYYSHIYMFARIVNPKTYSTFEITQDSFKCMAMIITWVGHVPTQLAHDKKDIRSDCAS